MTKRWVGLAMIAAGVVAAAYGGFLWWHGERVFARMRPTTCTLVSKSVSSNLVVYQPRPRGESKARYVDDAELVFEHTLGGRTYQFNENELPPADFEQGRSYPCRYDTEEPGHATLTTGFVPSEPVQDLVMAVILGLLGCWIRYTGWGPRGSPAR